MLSADKDAAEERYESADVMGEGPTAFQDESCKGYAGMNPASIVPFATEAEAQQAGYHKAKNCL